MRETIKSKRKMKKLLVISLVIMTLISCEKDDNQRINLDKDYFPLQIGNQWNFELAGKDSIIEITKINGIDYYEFVNDYGTTSYYRKQDNRIYFKSSSAESKEEMKFNLAANIGEKWAFGVGYVTLVSRNATITIGDTQVDSCLQFNFHNKDLIDYGSSIWLAPGIGFIQQTCQECFGSAFETLKLETARINDHLIEFE
ncbi:MAG: hypothetical protein JXR71_13080 [Bacteroidales bacterium]|nr:hypothetical protein [Bacteroidales bacterium]